MVRRSSKKSKQVEIVIVDGPAQLTKEGLLVLERYVDHGLRLPTVSAKTSYKDIWKHTKKLHATRKTMSVLASKISSASRQVTETYCSGVFELPNEEFRAFFTTQSRCIDDLLDDCEQMIQACQELEKGSEADLAKLQAEVMRVKVATNSKERRDLLLELTRAMPIIACVKDVFNELSDGLKAIQHELNILEDNSDVTFHRILSVWEGIVVSGVQLLA
ncbi:hypothetical protein C8R44DRAFT_772788 [Mycena epipterygia]|nr:hypothetical protein C8R44DRAFT_772788 [Mycena epipterygia]